MYELYNTPAWADDLLALARKFERKAEKLQKKERKLMKQYRSTAKIETLLSCAKQLRVEVDRLAKEFPVGSMNERKPSPFSLPNIQIPTRGDVAL
jgi:hypothetical protein